MENSAIKYKAFICCSQTDIRWGNWLQQQLQRYKVPKEMVGKEGRDGLLNSSVGEVFLDTQEQVSTANIGAQQRAKLENSAYLLVICSPAAAESQWINEQILEFKRLGKENRILCFIVDGEPNASDIASIAHTECFPHNIKYCLSDNGKLGHVRTEPIAADARAGKDGKANATLKLLAGILGVNFNDLRQREVLRAKKRNQFLGLLCSAILLAISLAWYRGQLITQEKTTLQKQQQVLQSFTAAQNTMATQNWDQAVRRWLALSEQKNFALLSAEQQRELIFALHFSLSQQQPVIAQLRTHSTDVISFDISPNGKLFASSDAIGNVVLFRTDTWQPIHQHKDDTARQVWFSADNRLLVSRPHPEHSAVKDTSKPQIKLYSTDNFSMQPVEASSARESWTGDGQETVYATAASSGGQELASRDFIALYHYITDTIDILKVTDLTRISLRVLADESPSQIFINAQQQVVDVYYDKAGLLRYNLANQQLMLNNSGCHHNYIKAPLTLAPQPWLLSRVSESEYTLCHLQDPTLNQTIHNKVDAFISGSDNPTRLYFQQPGSRSYSDAIWNIATQAFLDDEARQPLENRLAQAKALQLLQHKSYNTKSLDLTPLPYFAQTDGTKINIMEFAPQLTITRQLETQDRIFSAAHDWYVNYVYNNKQPRAQLFTNSEQSAWFKFDSERSSRTITSDFRNNYIVLVQTQLPRMEARDDGVYDVSIGTTLTLADFNRGNTLFEQEVLVWALNPARDTLIFANNQGALYTIDLTADKLSPTLISDVRADYQHHERLLGGLDSENLILVTAEFELHAVSLRTKNIISIMQIVPLNDDEKSALTLTSSTQPVLQQRYLLVDLGHRKILLDIAHQQTTELTLDDGAEYLFDTPNQTLYFQLPGDNLLEYPLTKPSNNKHYGNLPLAPSTFTTQSLAGDITIARAYNHLVLLQHKISANKLQSCMKSDIVDTAFEPTQQLLASVSSAGLCVVDAVTLQPIWELSSETLQLNQSISAVFFNQPNLITLLLEDGHFVSLPLSINFAQLIKQAQQRLNRLSKQTKENDDGM